MAEAIYTFHSLQIYVCQSRKLVDCGCVVNYVVGWEGNLYCELCRRCSVATLPAQRYPGTVSPPPVTMTSTSPHFRYTEYYSLLIANYVQQGLPYVSPHLQY